jgi:Fe-S-cluster-containing dehydrogenase component/DMSO reductase anchor subunit
MNARMLERPLTAVEEYARWHERAGAGTGSYRGLIPGRRPGAGEQFAFEVNLDTCTGCKSCVVACHSLNGLDEHESWRDVGELTGLSARRPQRVTVTTACHHCADPACANGCPTLAYEKDAETGIVRHLDDQCFGCQYCVLKCPYDVPKFSAVRGIVRKCDMCHDRLSAGEAPACVQACPNEAIAIRIVSLPEVTARSGIGDRLVPGVASSNYTKPTTRYVTADASRLDSVRAADARRVEPEHAHAPLVVMLVFTQLGVGWSGFTACTGHPWAAAGAAVLTGAGLVASVAHLGRPWLAWKGVLGWRRSWLSREILAFGLHAPLGLAVVAPDALGAWPDARRGAAWLALATGLLAVQCSVMVYADTRRALWTLRRVTLRFIGTVALGWAAAATVVDSRAGWVLAALALGKWVAEERMLMARHGAEWSDDRRSALLLTGRLAGMACVRGACLLAVMAAGVVCAAREIAGPWAGACFGAAVLIAEGFERALFFRSVVALRMPGNGGNR